MNILEAYTKTLNTVKELQRAGIKVEITPLIPSAEELADPEMPKAQLPVEKWVHVAFFPTKQEETDLIYEKRKLLKGVSFDSGAGFGQLDWEIDWSFSSK